ncbi:hypothetical protein QVD17_16877 [Tagetes erecta]|uniref:Uncharacterized protein n=1 Tax=Tagetes erecta TaxID=13708 RepID=A0AAD8KYG8_TARER|nr:hypothetical protein QVD17_16877 [Tagetes erecta]
MAQLCWAVTATPQGLKDSYFDSYFFEYLHILKGIRVKADRAMFLLPLNNIISKYMNSLRTHTYQTPFVSTISKVITFFSLKTFILSTQKFNLFNHINF